MTETLSDLADRLKRAGRIGADDVLALRGAIYGGPVVTEEQVTGLVELDAIVDRAPEWGELYAEAMTDYVVRQQEPADYIDDGKAAWLMQVLAGELKADSGFEALARILETAESTPPALDSFALQKAKAVVSSRGAVGAADVTLLRRLVFAGGGANNIGVSREEADALFDIDDACRTGNDSAWAEFFAKAVADSLTAVTPFHFESRDDALRDDAWLAAREKKSAFLSSMLTHAPKVGATLNDIFHPYADMSTEWAAPEAAMETAETSAAAVTDDEAKWLIGRLGAGDLSEAERQLIELLKAHAVEVSDLLKPRFEAAAAVTAAHDWTAPTFGQRNKAPA